MGTGDPRWPTLSARHPCARPAVGRSPALPPAKPAPVPSPPYGCAPANHHAPGLPRSSISLRPATCARSCNAGGANRLTDRLLAHQTALLRLAIQDRCHALLQPDDEGHKRYCGQVTGRVAHSKNPSSLRVVRINTRGSSPRDATWPRSPRRRSARCRNA